VVFLAAMLYFPIAFVIVGIYGLVGVQLGIDAFGNNNDSQKAQLVFWTTIWSVLVFYFVQKWLKRFKVIIRWLVLLALPVGLVGGLSFAVIIYSRAHSSAGCDMKATLDTAIHATYPIEALTSEGQASGTAFAVSGDGQLVTAYHVIEGATELSVNLAAGKIPVSVVRTSPAYDVALLKMDKPTSQYLHFAASYAMSDQVYAIGWPGNAFVAGTATVTGGIISRVIQGTDAQTVDRTIPSDMQLVQTDAAVNPGNSGGALINQCGVVGVIDAISTEEASYGLPREEGISYAISGQTVKSALGL